MAVVLTAHPAPLLQSHFSSTHDTYYQAPMAVTTTMVSPSAVGSGFMANRPMHRVNDGGFADSKSTSHLTLVPGEALSLDAMARSPVVKKNTAHVRAVHGAVPKPSTELVSTTRSTYVPQDGSWQAPTTRRSLWGGSNATQYRPELLTIPTFDGARKEPENTFVPVIKKPKNIRDGMHVSPLATNDWSRASQAFGAHTKTLVPRAPATAPQGSPSDVVRALSRRGKTGLFAEYQGFEGSRGNGDWITECKAKFLNPKAHPEPAGSKEPPLANRTIMTWFPTDVSAKQAVEGMRQLDGTLVPTKPSLVHPSVWRIAQQREHATTVGPDPHLHKSNRRARTMPSRQ